MATINKFEDLIIWQDSKSLTLSIYKFFKEIKDFSLKDQIQRASVSVMNNIAEGFERETDAEFIRFLFITKASCGEVRSLLYLSESLGYINSEDSQKLITLTLRLSGSIYNFISYLKVK